MVGKRELDEDPGHPLVGVQVGDEPEQLVLGRVGGELVMDRRDAHLLARLLLAPHVERRGWILADEDGREPDRPPEGGNVPRHLGPDLGGERFPVHQGGGHGRGA